ncbi:hypothetical protein TrCOL_g13167 [Triparma columacea]|uniref:C2 domain-containing protein n=1 Tax=Triparma columacea TaxID=722753 RepID=A0A9W7GLI0_9STRA|nr:hypothetical protein TrCOL_g13167 [Triparma columacea]
MNSPRPALLPNLLLRRNWNGAIDRLNENPGEALLRQTEGQTLLHAAVEKLAPVGLIESLINAYPDACSERDAYGRLPLHLAVDFERISEIVTAATLSAKAAENPINQLPKRALSLSPNRLLKETGLLGPDTSHLERKRIEVIEVLLSAFPTAAWLADDNGRLPLHVAAWRSAPPKVIAILLEKNPSAAMKVTRDGNLPLHLAAWKVKSGNKSSGKKDDHHKKGEKGEKGVKGKAGGKAAGGTAAAGSRGGRKPQKSSQKSPSMPAVRPSTGKKGGSGTRTPPPRSPTHSPKTKGGSHMSPLQKQKMEGRKARQHILKYLRDAEAYSAKAWPEPSPEEEEEEGGGMTDEEMEEKRFLEEEDAKMAGAIADEIARCEARIKNLFLKQDKKTREREKLAAERRERRLEQEERERKEEEKDKEEGGEKEGERGGEEKGRGEGKRVVVPSLAPHIEASSDPVVKLLATSLSRNNRLKTNFLLKTNVIEKNCKNPKWDEYFELTVGEEFLGRPFTLQVFDYDEMSGDDPCGCVVFNLDDLPCISGEAKCDDEGGGNLWQTLISNPDPSFKGAKIVTGELKYQASWEPETRLLKLHVLEARNLAPKDFGDAIKTRVVKPKKKAPSPEPKKAPHKPKKDKTIESELEVLDLLLRYNCDGVNEKDGKGRLPKQIPKMSSAKVLLDNLHLSKAKNLVRWSHRENLEGDEYGEKQLTMKMSKDVMRRVMEHEEERGLVFEDHRFLLDGEEEAYCMDSARSALDYIEDDGNF